MPLPDYIDNSHHTLQTVLETIIKDERQLTLDIAPTKLLRENYKVTPEQWQGVHELIKLE